MSVLTRQPTSNQTPDATLGGQAVSGISNTGHTSTLTQSSAVASPPPPFVVVSDSDSRSARWFAVQSVAGQKISVRLQFSWNVSGNTSGDDGGGGGAASSSSSFSLDYSLNGGGSWITHVSDSASTTLPGGSGDSFSNSGSADITLLNSQDTSLIQVRIFYQTGASATGGEILAANAQSDVTGSVSGIQVQVTTVDANVIFIS